MTDGRLSVQRAMAWSGIPLMVFFVLGFWVIAGFVPAHSPNDTAQQTAQWYLENTTRIRLGLWLTTVPAVLFAPWTVAIGMQIRRTDPALAQLQTTLGVIFVLEFYFPIMIWQTAAYRPDGVPTEIQRLHDLGWLLFVGVVGTAVLQAVAIATAIFIDDRRNPVFPRWAGYLNLWCAVLFLPGSMVVFFKSGPLSYRGLIAWWCLAAAFAVWVVVMSALVLQALNRQAAEAGGAPPADSPEANRPTDLGVAGDHG